MNYMFVSIAWFSFPNNPVDRRTAQQLNPTTNHTENVDGIIKIHYLFYVIVMLLTWRLRKYITCTVIKYLKIKKKEKKKRKNPHNMKINII